MTLDRITINPGRMDGQPYIRNLRLTVRRVIELVALYPLCTDLFREYPELEEEDVRQALAYAAATIDDRADFHALLATNGAAKPSGIRVRIERLRAEAVVDLLTAVLDRWSEVLDSGALLTVQPGRVRIHHLPVRGER